MIFKNNYDFLHHINIKLIYLLFLFVWTFYLYYVSIYDFCKDFTGLVKKLFYLAKMIGERNYY